MDDWTVFQLITKKFYFAVNEKEGEWGVWLTARDIAQKIGIDFTTQRSSRTVTKIMKKTYENSKYNIKISRGYTFYYVRPK